MEDEQWRGPGEQRQSKMTYAEARQMNCVVCQLASVRSIVTVHLPRLRRVEMLSTAGRLGPPMLAMTRA
eukprot:3798717-Alexandrium_andersonii.AAC.1